MRVPKLADLIKQEQEKLQEEPLRTYVELLMAVLEHKEPITAGGLWDLCVFLCPGPGHEVIYLNVLSGYKHEFGLAPENNERRRDCPLDQHNLVAVVSRLLEATSEDFE